MASISQTEFSNVPDQFGRFGDFGGRFVPETLTHALNQLETEYNKSKDDPEFVAELNSLWADFVGRPSPL